MTDKLFLSDTGTLTVKELPYTRDRAMCTSPIFHSTRKKALTALRSVVEENYRIAAEKLFSLWAELDDETETGIPKDEIRLLEKYGTATLIDNLKRIEAAEEVLDKAELMQNVVAVSVLKLVRRYRETYPKQEGV